MTEQVPGPRRAKLVGWHMWTGPYLKTLICTKASFSLLLILIGSDLKLSPNMQENGPLRAENLMIFLIKQWCSYATAREARLSLKMIGKIEQREKLLIRQREKWIEMHCVFDFDVESVLKKSIPQLSSAGPMLQLHVRCTWDQGPVPDTRVNWGVTYNGVTSKCGLSSYFFTFQNPSLK